ncbi:unnamed protein product [Ilex paraguariensis]|uniref:Ankyrin repeat protein n=1 Tax=Ilex paraguariensis TaxID=185542 RepID=A0ABC8UKF8_9AQUA
MGADVNQKPFRGFATTASVREGHLEILEILLKAGASQAACEEALLEASCHGRARLVEVQDLKGSPCRADELFKSSCKTSRLNIIVVVVGGEHAECEIGEEHT